MNAERSLSSTDVSFQARACEPGGEQIARLAPAPAELDRLTSQAREYIRAAKSQATLRAYRSDRSHFARWEPRERLLCPSRLS